MAGTLQSYAVNITADAGSGLGPILQLRGTAALRVKYLQHGFTSLDQQVPIKPRPQKDRRLLRFSLYLVLPSVIFVILLIP